MSVCACCLSGGCACEAIAKLTPAVREEIQEHYLRSWLARRKRAEFQQRLEVPVKRYDHAGRLMSEIEPGRPSVSQDQAPRGSQTRNYRVSQARAASGREGTTK